MKLFPKLILFSVFLLFLANFGLYVKSLSLSVSMKNLENKIERLEDEVKKLEEEALERESLERIDEVADKLGFKRTVSILNLDISNVALKE